MLVQFQPELPDLCRGDEIWQTYLAQTQGFAGSTPAPGTILLGSHSLVDCTCLVRRRAPCSVKSSNLLPSSNFPTGALVSREYHHRKRKCSRWPSNIGGN
jgi:hypothetical protein